MGKIEVRVVVIERVVSRLVVSVMLCLESLCIVRCRMVMVVKLVGISRFDEY